MRVGPDAGDEAVDAFRRASPRVRMGIGAAVVLVLVGLAAAVVAGSFAHDPAQTTVIEPATETTDTASGLLVHIGGAVAHAGVYRLGGDARVLDAVTAAGGLTDDAAADAVNLARALTDGEQIHVPTTQEQVAAGAEADAGGRVNINTADPATLEALPGVGPALAARIVQWREANGPFGSAEDLVAVSGIGERTLDALRDLVSW